MFKSIRENKKQTKSLSDVFCLVSLYQTYFKQNSLLLKPWIFLLLKQFCKIKRQNPQEAGTDVNEHKICFRQVCREVEVPSQASSLPFHRLAEHTKEKTF